MTEPARNSHFHSLAPGFALRLYLGLRNANLNFGIRVGLFESLRVPERQEWLYAQGRTRPGKVITNASTVWRSWHGFGLAGDIAFLNEKDWWYWPSDESLWIKLEQAVKPFGLVTGRSWKSPDAPHVQPENVKVSPSSEAKRLYDLGGYEEVWKATGMLYLPTELLKRVELKAA